MRCRVTESRATFFDTTTAYPFPSLEASAVKFADENLFPPESSAGNASRASRSLRGNTEKSGREARTAGAAAALHYFTAGARFHTRTKPVGSGTLAFLRLIGLFGHVEIWLCT